MKTVFIVNPKAGKKKNIEKLIERIKKGAENISADVEIYQTKAVGDATRFVRDYCTVHGKARFIACGGDGTLCEVLNGAIDFAEAEIGVMPFGTGNDFVKNFDGCFDSVEAQILSVSEKCDAIKYTAKNSDETTRVGYCANMFNIGFDCNVVDAKESITEKTFFSGPLAYYLGIFTTLIKKKGADLEIEVDGKVVHKGKLLLTSIANGCYCGGGIKSNPRACVHNSRMNVNIIKNISRITFIGILPHYMKGTHMQKKGIEKVITNVSCEKLTLRPNGIMRICNDGEITSAGDTTFEILHDAFNFVVPSVNAAQNTVDKQTV